MVPNGKNPALLAAGRAPNAFCLAAEGSEDNKKAPHFRGNVIGIDPGVSGALALVTSDGGLLEVFDMPVLADGPAGRRTVNAPLLAELLARWHAREVICEFVSARPKGGPVGAFSFGGTRGVVEGVCAALSLPIRFLTPPAWKRIVGLAPGKAGAKDAARSEAIRRWPDKGGLFARVRDDGRAESALIGLAGVLRECSQ
jgi:crossover junction endodeoxyribonuclease RuvC